MRRIFLVILVLGAFLGVYRVALAIGGGGGGSVPPCSEDNWDCTGWSQCSALGSQTRVCTLTYDCPSANTLQPPETQSCTPPSTATPAAAERQKEKTTTKMLSCTKDTWICGAWSESCDIYGREHRTCRLAFDCSRAETPPPSESESCRKLQCGNKSDLRERISCRLNLSPAGVARELALQYLPEACRVKKGSEQKECLNLYKSFQPCWMEKEGAARFSCARRALKLGPEVSQEIAVCQSKKILERAGCRAEIKEKVLYDVAFRFYDLENRAEELEARGADLGAVADFEVAVELAKQILDKAATLSEQRQVIYNVRSAWRNFVVRVKDQVK